MHATSDWVIKTFTRYVDVNEVIDVTLFKISRKFEKDQSEWESEFIFNSFQLTYQKCHKVNLIHGSSYIDSPDWIKKKKATINPKTIDDVFSMLQRLH